MISGAGEPSRAARAMAAVEEYLVRRGQELVLLFTPPFDGRGPDPGTSPVTRRVSAKTVVSTHTPPSGP